MQCNSNEYAGRNQRYKPAHQTFCNSKEKTKRKKTMFAPWYMKQRRKMWVSVVVCIAAICGT